ncbi:PREDICTED: modifier of mdg4-like isoform X5 [Drosophila arizonae]|uniref:Modifier of mdg4-like isoform X5 n=1 Tax=Drosophila arizonae TaxID=7263 RepID=A0ABM1PEM6_DROAR|nr:PREDICTED: modifier of mdg4-like isoform X5 [Drosophila arizonae]
MADDEQFSLCWNNFNTNLSAGFHESLCRGDLVDVSLAAEGQIVKAHRLVLSVCSPFFRKMFTQMPSNTHAIVFLNNVSHSALKDLIQFMYCGEVNVKQDALPAFISTAESLQIKGLTDNDPAPQPPQEPTPPPAAPHVQQQQQQIPAQRVQRQQPRTSARYKIETVDDVLGDDKATTQIVIQTTAAPQATIVQQPQQQQQQQHIQTQQLQTGTTTTATLVSTNKRAAQRGSLIGSGAVKRSKTSTTTSTAAANVIDPLESTTDTSANATTSTQQLGTQQITVQTTVVAADTKVHQVRQQQQQQQQQQQAAAQEEAEYIDLPMELPTKSEPDYSEEHAEVAGDGDTPYVEDDAYGDMRYDDSYFTENEDAGNQTGGNTSTSIAATTSKAVVKQQSQSYSDSSFVDTGADQGNTEAQAGKIKFIRSQKKNAQLVYKDYIYNKKLTQANGQTTWRCADVLKLRCKAVVITKNGEFVDARRQHNHESHVSRIGQRQLYNVEEELDEYIEICTSNPKISQYLSSSNISIMTAKDGKECKLYVPASEATEIEMQALVDAADDEEDEMIEQVVELKPMQKVKLQQMLNLTKP